jgi:guanylate kinase
MNIFLLGKSAVGKTTIVNSLCDTSSIYYAPPLLTTRSIRNDDDPSKIRSISVDHYLKLRTSGQLYTDIDDGITYYGYLSTQINNRVHLMYGSPFQVDKLCKEGQCILIERETKNIEKIRDETRIKINESIDLQYYKNPIFRQKMDIIVYNSGLLSDTITQIENFINKLTINL